MQELFGNLWNLQWQQVVMWGIGGLLIWLAIKKEMEPSLLPGELTAGIVVRIEHNAATPLGGTVRMTARYQGPEGKFYRFEVIAFDDAGEVFRGQHVRAVVEAQRLEKGAARRLRR